MNLKMSEELKNLHKGLFLEGLQDRYALVSLNQANVIFRSKGKIQACPLQCGVWKRSLNTLSRIVYPSKSCYNCMDKTGSEQVI